MTTYIFSIVIGLLPFLVRGQPGALTLSPDFTEVQANHYFTYFNTPKEISADSAWHVFNQSPAPVKPLDKVNFGSINGYYWFTANLKNASPKSLDFYLEIPHPHIYQIKFYRVIEGVATL